LVRSKPVSDLAGLIPAARAVPWKSKGTAATWSLVPGLGQMYVGERGSGIARLAIALAAAGAIATPIVVGLHRSSGLTFRHDWPLLALGLSGLVVLSIDYTDSYRDAMRGVIQWNERAETAFEDSHPLAPEARCSTRVPAWLLKAEPPRNVGKQPAKRSVRKLGT